MTRPSKIPSFTDWATQVDDLGLMVKKVSPSILTILKMFSVPVSDGEVRKHSTANSVCQPCEQRDAKTANHYVSNPNKIQQLACPLSVIIQTVALLMSPVVKLFTVMVMWEHCDSACVCQKESSIMINCHLLPTTIPNLIVQNTHTRSGEWESSFSYHFFKHSTAKLKAARFHSLRDLDSAK